MLKVFVLCPHCSKPHTADIKVCPTTGKALSTKLHDPKPPKAWTKHPLVGKKLGEKYLIRGVLGEGGAGIVFDAVNTALNRPVAIKVVTSNRSGSTRAMLRLEQEARIAGSIGHPNICDVLDVDKTSDGRPYLVMERLTGASLAQRLRAGAIPTRLVLEIMTQVLSGLATAHKANVLHRDIKPHNIFLSERAGMDPVAKILDFGFAKLLAGGSLVHTARGIALGTPIYMSPEQLRAEPLDARTDLFSSGIVFYECLTRRRPFKGSILGQIGGPSNYQTPIPLCEIRTDLDLRFQEVAEKAMHPDREKRYQSALAFQKDVLSLRPLLRDSTSIKRESWFPWIAPAEPESSTTSTGVAARSVEVIFDEERAASDDGARTLAEEEDADDETEVR